MADSLDCKACKPVRAQQEPLSQVHGKWQPGGAVQDAVPRSGKFLVLFKLGGHRVVINRMGDLVVRPSPLEASLRQIPAGAALWLGNRLICSSKATEACIQAPLALTLPLPALGFAAASARCFDCNAAKDSTAVATGGGHCSCWQPVLWNYQGSTLGHVCRVVSGPAPPGSLSQVAAGCAACAVHPQRPAGGAIWSCQTGRGQPCCTGAPQHRANVAVHMHVQVHVQICLPTEMGGVLAGGRSSTQ